MLVSWPRDLPIRLRFYEGRGVSPGPQSFSGDRTTITTMLGLLADGVYIGGGFLLLVLVIIVVVLLLRR